MTIRELLNIDSDIEVKDIKINSKKVLPGDIFVCVSGVNFDRHEFIDEAIENGASLVIVSKNIKRDDVVVYKVDNCDTFLPILARKRYSFNQDDFVIIGVTGTDGKTSTATIISEILPNCGYIGTNGYKSQNVVGHLDNTTPDSDILYKIFEEFKKDGVKYISMEVSSEAMYRNRVSGLLLDYVIVTNVSSEHLNVHKTLENYIECKMKVASLLKEDGTLILNSDDKYYERFKNLSKNVITYGRNGDFKIENYSLYSDHTDIEYSYKGEHLNYKSPLLAEFNIYNLAAALVVIKEEQVPVTDISHLTVAGRLMTYKEKDYTAIVDYAHTENGILLLLKFIQKLNFNNIRVVVGQAGGRDVIKRPLVGKVLNENANMIYLTAEDSRMENVQDIFQDIVKDIEDKSKFKFIPDRKVAISTAFDDLQVNDVILVLGKGTDDYHIFGSTKAHLNDVEEMEYQIIRRRYI